MERLNLDELLKLINERTRSVIEIDFAGVTLQVCDAESLPQRFRLSLARAQASLQDYYAEVIGEQNQIQAKLEDETLSSTQRVALQKEATEVAVNIAMKMFSASQLLMDANIQYIESLAQLDQGQLMEYINGSMDEKNIVGDRRDVVSAMLVARTSQLIRAAMDDAEKNFQDQVAKTVRIQSGSQLSAVMPIVEAAAISAVSGKKLKSTSAAAS
jgi:hypothetical protein